MKRIIDNWDCYGIGTDAIFCVKFMFIQRMDDELYYLFQFKNKNQNIGVWSKEKLGLEKYNCYIFDTKYIDDYRYFDTFIYNINDQTIEYLT